MREAKGGIMPQHPQGQAGVERLCHQEEDQLLVLGPILDPGQMLDRCWTDGPISPPKQEG